ncbi:MAG: hypothetical protein QNJ88_09480, partial [Acidimicrobiia bacterium]|nr:hypothetical protein [Acidimicrobiia bacterium]
TVTGELIYRSDHWMYLQGVDPKSEHALVFAGEDYNEVLSLDDWSLSPHPVPQGWPVGFSADGSRFVTAWDDISVYDTATWEVVSALDPRRLYALAAVSPSASLVALGTLDGFVRVYEFDTGTLTQTISMVDQVVSLEFVSDTQLLAVLRRGPGIFISLDVDDLLSRARDRVTRSFTPVECEEYQIECPEFEAEDLVYDAFEALSSQDADALRAVLAEDARVWGVPVDDPGLEVALDFLFALEMDFDVEGCDVTATESPWDVGCEGYSLVGSLDAEAEVGWNFTVSDDQITEITTDFTLFEEGGFLADLVVWLREHHPDEYAAVIGTDADCSDLISSCWTEESAALFLQYGDDFISQMEAEEGDDEDA